MSLLFIEQILAFDLMTTLDLIYLFLLNKLGKDYEMITIRYKIWASFMRLTKIIGYRNINFNQTVISI